MVNLLAMTDILVKVLIMGKAQAMDPLAMASKVATLITLISKRHPHKIFMLLFLKLLLNKLLKSIPIMDIRTLIQSK